MISSLSRIQAGVSLEFYTISLNTQFVFVHYLPPCCNILHHDPERFLANGLWT